MLSILGVVLGVVLFDAAMVLTTITLCADPLNRKQRRHDLDRYAGDERGHGGEKRRGNEDLPDDGGNNNNNSSGNDSPATAADGHVDNPGHGYHRNGEAHNHNAGAHVHPGHTRHHASYVSHSHVGHRFYEGRKTTPILPRVWIKVQLISFELI